MKLSLITLPLAAVILVAGSNAALGNPVVGGAAMFETKNIVEKAAPSADHTVLVAAVKAAGLVETLALEGPFTVFAPTNAKGDTAKIGAADALQSNGIIHVIDSVLLPA
jgi:uncharacterized surface protein with fasciclin (FAS1) repeats